MRTREDRLRRLFEVVKSAPEESPAALPEYLKTRVLAHWRTGTLAGDTWSALAALFRRALLCACIAMAVCVAWSYGELTQAPDNDLAIASYELRTEVMP